MHEETRACARVIGRITRIAIWKRLTTTVESSTTRLLRELVGSLFRPIIIFQAASTRFPSEESTDRGIPPARPLPPRFPRVHRKSYGYIRNGCHATACPRSQPSCTSFSKAKITYDQRRRPKFSHLSCDGLSCAMMRISPASRHPVAPR